MTERKQLKSWIAADWPSMSVCSKSKSSLKAKPLVSLTGGNE